MPLFQTRSISVAWLLAVAGSWLLLVLAMVPPWLGGESGSAVMAGFSSFCHQIPGRSFQVNGVPFAVCHRDFGILSSLAIGVSVVAPLMSSSVRETLAQGDRAGKRLLLSVIPTALDWFIGTVGIWTNTPFSRSATGAVFGLTAGIVLAAALLAPQGGKETPTTASFSPHTNPSD